MGTGFGFPEYPFVKTLFAGTVAEAARRPVTADEGSGSVVSCVVDVVVTRGCLLLYFGL